MSSEITTAFVKQYNAEVMHLSQQKGSRLENKVRRESQNGKEAYYDRLGKAAAVVKASRHSDTPQIDSAHSRRRVTLVDYEWADLIDKEDLRRLLMNPAGPYAQAAAWALGRSKDEKIIEKADGNAFGGEEGGTTVAHPNSQKVAFFSGTVGANINVDGLRIVNRLFGEADVDEMIPKYCATNAKGIESLLEETEVTSSDYASVKALVMGDVNSFMGFEFTRTQLIGTQSGSLAANFSTGAVGSGSDDVDGTRKHLFWAKDGILLATADDIQTKIDPRVDKSYSTQVYASQGIGATRMEEEKVVVGFGTE